MAGQWDDITLMAYADGELDAASASTVEAALREDHEAAERVACFRRSGPAALGALAGSLSDPIPERLLAAARGVGSPSSDVAANVVAFSPRRRPGASRLVGWAMAAAVAGLVVGFAGGSGFPLPSGGSGAVRLAGSASGLDGDQRFAGALKRALDSPGDGQAVGQAVGWEDSGGRPAGRVQALGLIDAQLGVPCRGFRVDWAEPATPPARGLGCREVDGSWSTMIVSAGAR